MENKVTGTGLSELNVAEQLSLLKSILESSTEYAILAKDLHGNILTWNTGATIMYGFTGLEMIGKNADILHDPADLKSGKVAQIVADVQGKGTWSGEIRCVHKDGHHFNALVTVTLRKDNNIPIGYTFIARDITDLQNTLNLLDAIKKSDELLKLQNRILEKAVLDAHESSRLQSEFLTNVSHELRTPLNGILGFSQLIYDNMVDPSSPKHKEFIGDIISSGKHLLNLINDLLDLAKIEANKIEFHPVKIDFIKFSAKVKSVFHTFIKRKKIQFEIIIDPALGDVVIDEQRLRQVFHNYISNALKFTEPGGRVQVRVCAKGKKHFCLEVEDTGIGIHDEDIDKLFGKFFQLDTGIAKKFTGTGLGLALTKRIVEAQGGKVGVSSTFGKGSIFYVTLPCYPQHRHIVSERLIDKHPIYNNERPTVLIVEQDSAERSVIVDALQNQGYTVLTAENVIGAVEHHREQRFDVIILDLLEPDLKNWEIIRTLRSKLSATKSTPILIKVMIEQPISLGFRIHDFLVKPVEPSELIFTFEALGVSSHSNKCILIIDCDESASKEAKQTLENAGFRVICTANKVGGLLALEKEQPDAVLLDPFMPGTDGFDFLHSYRLTERGLYTPLIMWTTTKLTREERERFKNSIQRIVLERESLQKNIISELERHLPPP